MATIAQLNVAIGASIAELQKGLKAAERELRVSGQKFSRIGTEISTGLSIPLGLAGVGAIKAAGDIESLTLALKSQLGTADAAAKEFKLLNDAAKNPGLGLEQAIQGSVRLQGVKFSAEEARKVLIQMGNAIASTGGTAENLDSVTKQFAQMSSKGRVLQEDISVLAENMPALSGLMQKAFGTTNVEAIREMGVSGKEFVLEITKAAEALPRVEGGIKNSIGNAMDSLKQSAAKVGIAINSAFNVTGAVEGFSNFVLKIAEGFSSLSPVVQKVILSIAGIAVAIGPILKVVGAVQLLRSQAVSGFESIVSGAKALAGGVLNAAKAFQALSAAQKATVIGAALAAVTALYFAYQDYSASLTDAEAAQKSVNDVTRAATASVEVERAKIGNLVGVLDDNSRSLADKKKALDQLKAISPSYFGDLDIEKGKVIGLATAVDAYVRSLERSAIVKQATDELAKQSEILRNISESGAPTILQQTGNALQALGSGLIGGIATIGSTADTFDKLNENTRTFNQLDLQSATQAKIDSLRELIKTNLDLTVSDNAATASSKKYAASAGELSKQGKVLAEVLSDVENAAPTAALVGDDQDRAKIEALIKGIKRLVDEGFKPASKEVQNLKAELDLLTQKPNPIVIDIIRKENGSIAPVVSETPQQPNLPTLNPLPAEALGPSLEETQALADAWRDTYISAAQDVSNAIFDITAARQQKETDSQIAALEREYGTKIKAAKGNSKLEEKLQQELAGKIDAAKTASAKKSKRLAIVEATINTAVAITKAIASAPPPLNIPAIVAASIAGAAQIATIAATPLASGTRDARGGLTLVGERGPEILNIPKHSQVFSAGQTHTALQGANKAISLDGQFTISGVDLVLLLDRINQKNARLK